MKTPLGVQWMRDAWDRDRWIVRRLAVLLLWEVVPRYLDCAQSGDGHRWRPAGECAGQGGSGKQWARCLSGDAGYHRLRD